MPSPTAADPTAAALRALPPSTRELLSAGAAAGLLPFARAHAAGGALDLLSLPAAVGASVVAVGATSAATAAVLHAAQRLPTTSSGGDGTPETPSRAPGNAGAGGVAAAAGGAASGVWCALLLCCMLTLAAARWRHRFALSPPAPSGVVLLLQRPG